MNIDFSHYFQIRNNLIWVRNMKYYDIPDRDCIFGPPKETETFSEQELINKEIVGLYRKIK